MTQDKARKRAARQRAAETGESYTRAARLTAAARSTSPAHIEVVEPPESFDRRDLWHRWGVVERVGTGYRIIVVPFDTSALHLVRAEQYPLARVDYTTSESWEPASVELLPVAWERSDGRWIWAVNGWAVDDPGDIADAPARTAPAAEVQYEVRLFTASRDGWTWGVDYSGSHPTWETRAWCHTIEEAHIVAEAARRWRDGARRAQVWGPDPDRPGLRAKLTTMDAKPDRAPRPGRRFGTLPDEPRPVSPPPASPPAWYPDSDRSDRHEFHLRVWAYGMGWISAGWYCMRQLANVAAADLAVGADGHPFQYGDIWGPPRDDKDLPKRALMDVRPDRLLSEDWPPTLVMPAGL